MKKTLLVLLMVTTFVISLPQISFAGALTVEQINSIVLLLQSFGADSGAISNVKNVLSENNIISVPATAVNQIPSSQPGGSETSTTISVSSGGGTSPVSGTCVTPIISTTKIGSVGSDVSNLQSFLIKKGYDIPAVSSGVVPKGYYGIQTKDAVTKYQKNEGLTSTGVVDTKTLSKINSTEGPTKVGCVLPPPVPNTVSEQIKCVFNGATTEQKCNGVGQYTMNNGMEIYPPQFYCSGVGSCVTKVSGPKGMKLTWNSSCAVGDKLPSTTIDGNDEYANFNCGTSNNLPPVINGISAPTTLSVGQMGTWTVKAYDPENGSLSYSVTWGDEYKTTVGQNTTSNASVQQFTQSTSFTHSYSSSGVYTVNVTVKDNAGLTSQTSATVNVGNVSSTNNPPKIVGFPAIQTGIKPGQTVNISLSAEDSDNDDLSWSVDWGENVGETSSCSLARRQTGTGWKLSKSHSWANAGVYKVKVTVSDCVGGSDSYSFIVTVGDATESSITVLSPNGGESWQKGTTQTIKWKDNTPPPPCAVNGDGTESEGCFIRYDIKLAPYYSPCTGPICPAYPYINPYTIAKNIRGSSYSWGVGLLKATWCLSGIDDASCPQANVPDGSYIIQVCQTDTTVCDSSDSYFKITSATTNVGPSSYSGDGMTTNMLDALKMVNPIYR